MISKMDSGLYSPKMLLATCVRLFSKDSSIALLVTQTWLKVTLWATLASSYTGKDVGEANGSVKVLCNVIC